MTSPSDSSFDEIASKLSEAQSILVASHVRPDGDAYGSTLAMALWLRGQGKKVVAWNEDGMLEKFTYLPGHGMISAPSKKPETFDAVVALDTSTRERLGENLLSSASAPVWINMDHHVSNGRYGTLNHIPGNAPATGEVLYDFFAHIGADITADMAANLYAAIATDTGSFQYPSTTDHTFDVAAHLVRCGVNVGELSQKIHESHPRRRLELLRELLNSAKFTCNDRVASFSLSASVAGRLKALPEDNEGLIDHLRSVQGVLAAVFFEELPGEGKVRVSMRSKNHSVNVCKACEHFGGGGHVLAAGARVRGSLQEVEGRVLEYLCNEIGKLH